MSAINELSRYNIKEIASNIFDAEDIRVYIYDNQVDIEVTSEYQPPGLSLPQVEALRASINCKTIHDTSVSQSGCETCDYGSRYGYTLSCYF